MGTGTVYRGPWGLEVIIMGKWLAGGCVLAMAGAACGSSSKTTENGNADSGGGGSQGGGASFACSVSVPNETNNCTLYMNVSASDEAKLKSNCTSAGGGGAGTVTSSCPTSGVVGSCANMMGTYSQVEYAYSSTGATALQTQCKSEGGTWSGPGGGSTGNACKQLAGCCKNFTSFESSLMQACTAAVSSGNEEMCATQLTAAMAETTCSADAG
jgi:hypothetical protein